MRQSRTAVLVAVLFFLSSVTIASAEDAALHKQALASPSGTGSQAIASETIPTVTDTTRVRVRFPTAVSGQRLVPSLTARGVRLESMSASFAAFSAVYLMRDGETPDEGLASFAADVQRIYGELLERKVIGAGLDADLHSMAASKAMGITDVTVIGEFRQAAALAADMDANAKVEMLPPQPRSPRLASQTETDATSHGLQTDAIVTAQSTSFSPSTGSVSYNSSTKELWSYFSWKDISWTSSTVGYEHDIVLDGARNAYVKWGSGTYASNLPNWYRDDETSDTSTIFTVGSYPARVSANTQYFVRIPIQVVSTIFGSASLKVSPQIGSWADTNPEKWYCFVNGSASASCVFADQSLTDLRLYRDRNPTTPLYAKILFDVSPSWSYSWDRTFDYAAKQCPEAMYRGEYYNDVQTGTGDARYVRCDADINFSWGYGGPGLGIRNDLFSVRWTKRPYFSNGTYNFLVRSDDGLKLSLDNIVRLNVGATSGSSVRSTLATGYHTLQVDYSENYLAASVSLQTFQVPPSPPYGTAASSPSARRLLARWADGSADETLFRVEVKPANSGWYEVTTAPANATSAVIDNLPAGTTVGVRLRACNAGGCSGYSNDAYSYIQGSAPVTLLSEGAESGAPGWAFSATGGAWWSIENSSASYQGSRRFRVGSGSAYGNNANATLTSPSLSLVGKSACTLSFAYKFDTEPNYDFFWAEISTDGGASWTRFTPRWSGMSPSGAAWDRATYTLGTSALGKPNVRIRFRFTSDGRTYRWGAAVDGISIVAQ